MTPAGFAGVEELERIANQAQAYRWDLGKTLAQAVKVYAVTAGRIETAAGTLVWSPVREHWHMAWVAAGYTRDEHGREVPIPPCTNLGGHPMTRAQAGLIALHEMARSGCTRVYYPATLGGGVR